MPLLFCKGKGDALTRLFSDPQRALRRLCRRALADIVHTRRLFDKSGGAVFPLEGGQLFGTEEAQRPAALKAEIHQAALKALHVNRRGLTDRLGQNARLAAEGGKARFQRFRRCISPAADAQHQHGRNEGQGIVRADIHPHVGLFALREAYAIRRLAIDGKG